MKIAHVRPIILSVELPDGGVFAYSQAWYRKRRSLVVEIETADGTVGYGESFGPPATNAALIDEVYAPILLGRDVGDRETLWLELYNAMRDHGRKGTALEALSAVDIALWDLAGTLRGAMPPSGGAQLPAAGRRLRHRLLPQARRRQPDGASPATGGGSAALRRGRLHGAQGEDRVRHR